MARQLGYFAQTRSVAACSANASGEATYLHEAFEGAGVRGSVRVEPWQPGLHVRLEWLGSSNVQVHDLLDAELVSETRDASGSETVFALEQTGSSGGFRFTTNEVPASTPLVACYSAGAVVPNHRPRPPPPPLPLQPELPPQPTLPPQPPQPPWSLASSAGPAMPPSTPTAMHVSADAVRIGWQATLVLLLSTAAFVAGYMRHHRRVRTGPQGRGELEAVGGDDAVAEATGDRSDGLLEILVVDGQDSATLDVSSELVNSFEDLRYFVVDALPEMFDESNGERTMSFEFQQADRKWTKSKRSTSIQKIKDSGRVRIRLAKARRGPALKAGRRAYDKIGAVDQCD